MLDQKRQEPRALEFRYHSTDCPGRVATGDGLLFQRCAVYFWGYGSPITAGYSVIFANRAHVSSRADRGMGYRG